jgi:monoamine oxidase
VPFIVLRRLDTSRAGFDALKRVAIDELGYGDHSKLILQFDQRYWREPGPWPGSSSGDVTYDGPFVQTWEASRGQPGTTGLLVDFEAAAGSAALHPTAPYTTSATPVTAAYARTFATELERVWPGATKHFTGKAVLSHVTMDPFARGSYAGWLRGQYTRFAGYERVRQGQRSVRGRALLGALARLHGRCGPRRRARGARGAGRHRDARHGVNELRTGCLNVWEVLAQSSRCSARR